MSKYTDAFKEFVSSHKLSEDFEDWLSGKGVDWEYIREMRRGQQERQQAIDAIKAYHKTDPVFHSTTYYDGLGRAVMIVSSCRTDKGVDVHIARKDGCKRKVVK